MLYEVITSNDQEWANYEAIQADIFDHIFSVVHEFDLKVFQFPSADAYVPMMEQSWVAA